MGDLSGPIDPSPPSRGILYSGTDLEDVEILDVGPGRAAVVTRGSPSKHSPNEDGLLVFEISPARVVLAVADGVGGLPGARQASTLALETLGRHLQQAGSEGSLREVLLQGIEAAHVAVLGLDQGGATTLVVADLHRRRLCTYHVGDSGLLAFGQRGGVRARTTFHSPVGYAIEAGLMDERDAMHHAERHLLSNAIGHEGMHVEIGAPLELADRDTFVLASDGLFDNMQTDEITEHLRKGDLLMCTRGLASICQRRMRIGGGPGPSKPDDMTLIAYRPARGDR